MLKKRVIIFCIYVFLFSCKKDEINTIPSEIDFSCDSKGAYSTCLKPLQSPEYYIDQSVKYFQTMESTIPINVQPNYSDLVIRWEWHPWLLLTGYKKSGLISSDILLKLNPTKYDSIDCRFFEKQPFCRCHVVFDYSGEKCPIYEEFTFNNQGEMTFIEAWSDYPSLIPMDKNDYWAEGDSVHRLSTKVPGLGNSEGRIDIREPWFKAAAKKDPEVGDLFIRLKDPMNTYFQELFTNFEELEKGCYAPPGDTFPYIP